MDFSTPWTPILNGEEVRSLTFLDFAAKMKTKPESVAPRDATWTVEAQRPFLRNVLGAPRDAVLETVLLLWRLKQMDSLGSEGSRWGDMVEAWLVRSNPRGRSGAFANSPLSSASSP